MYLDTPGYVYKITHKETGHIYYGSRVANVKHGKSPEQDLWIRYFTSSTVIKDLIETWGAESFIPEILYRNADLDEVYWTEQDFIKEKISDPLCLNEHYKDRETGHKIWSTHGKVPWNKGLTKDIDAGVASYSGENNGSKSPKAREKIKRAHTGREFTDSHCKNLSLSHQGINAGITYEELHGEEKAVELRKLRQTEQLGVKRTEEQNKNNSVAQKGKRWVTNGADSKIIFPGEEIPEGYQYGRSRWMK